MTEIWGVVKSTLLLVAAALCAVGCLERALRLDWWALAFGVAAVVWLTAWYEVRQRA